MKFNKQKINHIFKGSKKLFSMSQYPLIILNLSFQNNGNKK